MDTLRHYQLVVNFVHNSVLVYQMVGLHGGEKTVFFSNVIPYSLVNNCQCFGGTSWLHLHAFHPRKPQPNNQIYNSHITKTLSDLTLNAPIEGLRAFKWITCQWTPRFLQVTYTQVTKRMKKDRMRLFRPKPDTGILRYVSNRREPYLKKSDRRERRINAEAGTCWAHRCE